MTKLLRLPLLLLAPIAVPACQRYAHAPLDLAAHRACVAARDPSDAGVVQYANCLAASDHAPEAYDPSDGLSLDEAEVVFLFFNPELRLARLRAAVPRVGAAEAGRWEDPELGIDAERIIQSVENPWVLGGTLSFTIPLSGRLGVARKKAHSELSAAELRAVVEERRMLAELRADWANWSAATERAALTRQVVSDLEAVVGNAERLRQAGELGPVDARLLRIERVNQTAKLHGHEADAREAELRLKARLGLAPGARVTFRPSIPVPAADIILDDNGMSLTVAEHVRVRLARAEYEVAERTLELEVRKQYPDLRIGGGYCTDEGGERVLFGAGLPLPLFNANRRAIAEARASRDVARAAAEAEYEQLLAEAAAARDRLRAARERLAYVEKELAPLADQQVADARRLANLGEFDTLVLLAAIQAAHEAKLTVLDARLNAALSANRLDALLEGRTFAAPTTQKDHQP
jgi:outer membrane protein, heavy metal efflux system